MKPHPRRAWLWVALVAWPAAGTAACGQGSDGVEDCAEPPPPGAGVTSNALYGATARPGFIRIGEMRRRALVTVAATSSVPLPLCTGVIIDRLRVLTAKHCEFGGSAQVAIESEGGRFEWLVPSLIISHPTLDLSLLQLPLTGLEVTEQLQPIEPLDAVLDDAWLGTVVQLAGVGLTEQRALGELRFAAEPIVALSESLLEVDGAGKSGACRGDSGGPVLARGPDGAPRVLGILSDGARSCVGIDRYVRLDAVADWLRSPFALGSGPEATECGDVDELGLCQAGVAMFCEAGRIAVRVCEDACGWDADAGGYRCVSEDEDACAGVSATGQCEANVAERCERGRVKRMNCNACGGRCMRDAASGRVGCANYHSNARP